MHVLITTLLIVSAFIVSVHGYGSYVGILPLYSVHGLQPETERVPKFLKDASQEKIDEYHNLIKSNLNLNEKDLDEKVFEWVAKQSKEIRDNFAAHKAKLPEKKARITKAREEAVAKFSPEAKKVDEQLNEIYKDANLSVQEKRDKVNKILDKLDEGVKNEIRNAKKD